MPWEKVFLVDEPCKRKHRKCFRLKVDGSRG